MGQWISWPGAPLSNVSYVPSASLPGVLRNVSIQLAGLLQAPDDPLDLLMLCGWGWYSWSNSTPWDGGLARSTDGGASWHAPASQPPSGFVGIAYTDIGGLSLDGGDPDTRWWGMVNFGVYVSRDRGETWSPTVRRVTRCA